MNNDRKQLIRLAASRSVGDPVRRVLLAELQKESRLWWWQEEAIKNALGEEWGWGSTPYRKFFKSLDKRERSRLPKNNYQAWLKAMAKLIVASGEEADEKKALSNLRGFMEVLSEYAFQAYDDERNRLNDPDYLNDELIEELELLAIQEVNKL